jgi:hypothetical protein
VKKWKKGERKKETILLMIREILPLIPENVFNPLSLSAPASLSGGTSLNLKRIRKLQFVNVFYVLGNIFRKYVQYKI